jgi:hypothetical protein
MSEIVYQPDHVGAALGRLLQQYKSNAGIVAIVTAYAQQAQALEDALRDLYADWALSGSGTRLDQLGDLLDEPRSGDADSVYVVRLQAKVRALRSSGTAVDVLEVFKLLSPGSNIWITTSSGGDLTVDVGQTDSTHLPIFQRFLRQIKSGGVGAQGVYELQDASHTFTLDDSAHPGSTPGLGFDDANAPGQATAGQFAGVFGDAP